MNTYIGFLRGINVSGQKKIKMADLRNSLQKLGFKDVQSYIQSGNISFESNETNIEKLQNEIKDRILKDFGFDVPVLLMDHDTIKNILSQIPFSGNQIEDKNLYFALLHSEPQMEFIRELSPIDYPNEEFHISTNCVYLNCIKGAGKAKLTNNIIERKLKVTATTRNLRTMQKMLEMVS